jgi:hypothetical protein
MCPNHSKVMKDKDGEKRSWRQLLWHNGQGYNFKTSHLILAAPLFPPASRGASCVFHGQGLDGLQPPLRYDNMKGYYTTLLHTSGGLVCEARWRQSLSTNYPGFWSNV